MNDDWNVVILHCHFERGGVTQVVCNHIRALCSLSPAPSIHLVAEDRISGLDDFAKATCRIHQVDGFDYDDQVVSPSNLPAKVDALVASLKQMLRDAGLSPDNTVLHWHNHSLGKNVAAPDVISKLAGEGWRFLLQIHDFAEDCRPGNVRRLITSMELESPRHWGDRIYPSGPRIHYASLTGGDASVLRQIGIDTDRVHTLPNSVRLDDDSKQDVSGRSDPDAIQKVRGAMRLPSDAEWTLYPVRGIRRKNVGEWLLLSRWVPANHYAGITLSPATPIEAESYRRWRTLGRQVAPRAIFDAGLSDQISFTDNLRASRFVLSTSVAEGFGMVYLEPWLAGRRVLARRIDGVVDDFRDAGVDLSGGYDAIPVPLDAPEHAKALQQYQMAVDQAYAGLPPPFVDEAVAAAEVHLHPWKKSQTLDFAMLTPQHQISILRQCSEDVGFEAACKEGSAPLLEAMKESNSGPNEDQIRHNGEVIRIRFGLSAQADRLLHAYRSVLSIDDPPSLEHPASASLAFGRIVQSHRFFPCRTEDPIAG
ncbi:glycosyltransferase family 4 protein [Crateriforma spongiae]|uniref:glycosyltransferase family 4 protein n=1 Tax=Crateriforma spongiae TaxID=2724528 RepID=UPI001444D75D|nr:glycosyltransferase family 4 protein [Crateriforma spongiae]